MPCRRPSYRSESGQAMVEFALVLPILLVLVFGMMDFGKAFNYWIDETHLANTGARYAAVNKNPGPGSTLQESIRSLADTPELRDGGTNAIASPLQVCIAFIDTDGDGNTPEVGDAVKVTVKTTYNWLPFLDWKLGITETELSASATMRLEAVPTNYGAGCTS